MGSSSLVLRSTARTIVRSSTPSGLAATAGMIWRLSGRAKRTVNEPSGRSFTPWFFDYDEDGWLDLWVPAYDATPADLAADLLDRPFACQPPRLYRNNGDGTFTDRATEAGLHHPYRPMGANFGDLDNDGWLDIYLGTGDPEFTSLMPNVMLRNDRGRRFLDVTQATRLGHLQKGHGIGFADFDGDGDQDILHQLGGFLRGDRFHNALFLNPGPGGRFLHVSLVGTYRSQFDRVIRTESFGSLLARLREKDRVADAR